jgi:hypothetical protein
MAARKKAKKRKTVQGQATASPRVVKKVAKVAKRAVKKVAKRAAVKKVAKRAAVKKVAKRAAVKKVAKRVAKRAPVKKVAKRAPVKKVAKRTVAKRPAKKVAKRAVVTTKRPAKKVAKRAKVSTKKTAHAVKKVARPVKKVARPVKKVARPVKKTARPAPVVPVKKVARPTKKTARPTKKVARPTKKAAKVPSRFVPVSPAFVPFTPRRERKKRGKWNATTDKTRMNLRQILEFAASMVRMSGWDARVETTAYDDNIVDGDLHVEIPINRGSYEQITSMTRQLNDALNNVGKMPSGYISCGWKLYPEVQEYRVDQRYKKFEGALRVGLYYQKIQFIDENFLTAATVLDNMMTAHGKPPMAFIVRIEWSEDGTLHRRR